MFTVTAPPLFLTTESKGSDGRDDSSVVACTKPMQKMKAKHLRIIEFRTKRVPTLTESEVVSSKLPPGKQRDKRLEDCTRKRYVELALNPYTVLRMLPPNLFSS